MSLQLRRGTDADRLTITPVEGELVYCTDTKLMWVGDGTTVGGVPASSTVTGPSGSNTAYGESTLTKATTGDLRNTAIGQNALQINWNGSDNTSVGQNAGQLIGGAADAGSFVVGVTYQIQWAGDTDFTLIGAANNNTGTTFVATGPGTGGGWATQPDNKVRRNTFVGQGAGAVLHSGERNTFIGKGTCGVGEFVNRNVAVGQGAGYFLNKDYNVAIGQGSGQGSGDKNTAVGTFALSAINFKPASEIEAGKRYAILDPGNTDFTSVGASDNYGDTIFVATGSAPSGTGIVSDTDRTTTTGANNIGIGYAAGGNPDNYDFASGTLTTGSDCIFIGRETHPATGSDNNEIVIGNYATGSGSNTTTIGHTTTVQTKLGGKLVIANAPASAIGAAGDVAGMMSADANYIYHCTGTYDGSTAIWLRVAGSTW